MRLYRGEIKAAKATRMVRDLGEKLNDRCELLDYAIEALQDIKDDTYEKRTKTMASDALVYLTGKEEG